MHRNGTLMTPKNKIIEYGEAIVLAIILALFIRTFIVQAFFIPSGSMLDTLQIGDRLLVNKFLYGIKIPFTDKYLVRFSDPQRGDIIVFRYPEDPSVDFIKRIVGVPGDVLFMKDNVLYRNGKPVDEPFVRHSEPGSNPLARRNFDAVVVPEDEYFVMGDNRDNSRDSRYWGFVKRSAIHGKAWRIYWSSNGLSNIRLSRMGRLVE